jgi:hypothetical protein
MNLNKRWRKKQKLAAPGRYYGNGGTVHPGSQLDVEIHNGHVVAVWFRCQALPFQQVDVDAFRAAEMEHVPAPQLTGVEVLDPIDPDAAPDAEPAGKPLND